MFPILLVLFIVIEFIATIICMLHEPDTVFGDVWCFTIRPVIFVVEVSVVALIFTCLEHG